MIRSIRSEKSEINCQKVDFFGRRWWAIEGNETTEEIAGGYVKV